MQFSPSQAAAMYGVELQHVKGRLSPCIACRCPLGWPQAVGHRKTALPAGPFEEKSLRAFFLQKYLILSHKYYMKPVAVAMTESAPVWGVGLRREG